jgi:phosphoribosylcarboxyaminoimidazole (NCAIR) mutase
LSYGYRLAVAPSDRLREFLREHVSSFEELETLLLLAGASGRAWSDSEVAAALNGPVETVTAALSSLSLVDGLLTVSEQAGGLRYQFSPRSAQLGQLIGELAALHAEQRLTLMQLMSSNALERVRGAAMRRLADAFRLDRPKK